MIRKRNMDSTKRFKLHLKAFTFIKNDFVIDKLDLNHVVKI